MSLLNWVSVVVLLVSSLSQAQVVKLWVRPNGNGERKVVEVDLSAKPKTETRRVDLQYPGEKMRYRGVPLRSLLNTLERTNRSDLVLLHFDNGMSVPLPTDDLELLKRLDPFVATEYEVNGLWLTAFPMVQKAGAEQRDVRPLKFKGNKLVVSSAEYPLTTKAAQADGFSPFRYVGTLTGIEFVRSAEWFKQFDVGTTPQEKAGFEVYKGHCQYCHGIKEKGGAYGPDFVTPAPLVERLGVQELYLHVRYRDRDAPEKGLMMPFFRDVSRDDVSALQAWMQRLGTARPVPYVVAP
jgi:mono/diheme cytochrome c family protein